MDAVRFATVYARAAELAAGRTSWTHADLGRSLNEAILEAGVAAADATNVGAEALVRFFRTEGAAVLPGAVTQAEAVAAFRYVACALLVQTSPG